MGTKRGFHEALAAKIRSKAPVIEASGWYSRRSSHYSVD